MLSFLCVAPALAEDASTHSAAVDAIRRLEQEMADAMIAGDVDRLSRMYADDWSMVSSSGKVVSKERLLRDFKSGSDKLEWFENGPIDVQVIGNVAVAHASVKERRKHNGKDVSGESLWVDVLEKRAGNWVVVHSTGARVKQVLMVRGPLAPRRPDGVVWVCRPPPNTLISPQSYKLASGCIPFGDTPTEGKPHDQRPTN